MQKVYLLLRNNQQTGPYSFEELMALHLKPFDLVWIEGKSHGWRYPNEVEALKPYVDAPKPLTEPGSTGHEETRETIPHPSSVSNNAKKIFVSMPASGHRQPLTEKTGDPIEQKAEELRKRAQAYAPTQDPVQTNYARDLYQAEEEYTQWVYQKKTKKRNLPKKTVALVVSAILIMTVGWWAGGKMFQETTVAAPAFVQQQQDKKDLPISMPVGTQENEAVQDKSTPFTAELPAKTENRKKQEQGKKSPLPEKEIISDETKATTEETIFPDPVQSNNNEVALPEKEVVPEAPTEQKKTIKEKISELFKNKKAETDPGSAGTNNKERTATRRDENRDAVTNVTDVSDQVDIKTNKIADSWMMGVKNLKLTLVNRSNLTISSAKVEVLYYSEQNSLLEKKIISFSSIAPGKSQTVAAPDHRLADHIEHKIVFANGYENSYARQ